HAIDAMCAVLGEFAEISARVSTRIPEWRTMEGKPVPVDAPDSINIVGRMASGAEVSVNVAAVPSNPGGNRLEIYGREGALVIRANGALSLGPNQMHAGKGKEAMVSMPVLAKYKFAPECTPGGQPYNVAQAYARAAGALRGGGSFDVDFNLAVQRHQLIDTGAAFIFLGLGDGRAHFAIDATGAKVAPDIDTELIDVRARAPAIATGEAAILAEARSLLDWHARHRFCAQCGSPTDVASAGWVRRCPACRAAHFPRTDPVVIMLVIRGNRALLGRNQRRAGARFPC